MKGFSSILSNFSRRRRPHWMPFSLVGTTGNNNSILLPEQSQFTRLAQQQQQQSRRQQQFSSSSFNDNIVEDKVKEDLGPNPGLASVIAQGIKSLEDTAADVESRTRNKTIEPQSNQPTHRQLAESQRILEVSTDCLEDLCLKYQQEGGGAGGKSSSSRNIQGLHLQGQPIVILDVQVNKDVKQAKVFWTLPYSVLLDPNVNQRIYQRLVMVLQEQLEDGGAKVLAREVSTRLRHYYPPRIKLVPATDAMIQQAISEFHS